MKRKMSVKGVSKSPYNLKHALTSPGKLTNEVGKGLKGFGNVLRKKKR